jgi:hypothetical protein
MCKFNSNCSSNCVTACKSGNVILPEGPTGPAPSLSISNENTWVINGVDTGISAQGPQGVSITNIVDNGNSTWTINFSDNSSTIINAPSATVDLQNTGSGMQVYNTASGSTKLLRTIKPKGFLYGSQLPLENEVRRQDSLYHKIGLQMNPYFVYSDIAGNRYINYSGPTSNPIILTNHFIYMRPYDLTHHFLGFNIDIGFQVPAIQNAQSQTVVSSYLGIYFILSRVGNALNTPYWQVSQFNTDPLISGDAVTSTGSEDLTTLDENRINQIIQYPIIQNDISTHFYSLTEIDPEDESEYEDPAAQQDMYQKFKEHQLCQVLFGSPQHEDDYHAQGATTPAQSNDNFLVFGFINVKSNHRYRFKCRGSMFVSNEYKYL